MSETPSWLKEPEEEKKPPPSPSSSASSKASSFLKKKAAEDVETGLAKKLADDNATSVSQPENVPRKSNSTPSDGRSKKNQDDDDEPVELNIDPDDLREMKKYHTILRVSFVVISVLMAAAACVKLETASISTAFIALYVLFFSILICCFEAALSAVAKWISMNFGFMYTLSGRVLFVTFVAVMCFSLGLFGQIVMAITFLGLLFNIYVLIIYPKFDIWLRQEHYRKLQLSGAWCFLSQMYSLQDVELFILFLTTINTMNFIDRGIVPGATDEFTTFIDDTLNDPSSPSLFIGLLQSAFIVGICFASPVFATLSHSYNTFSIILSGMIVWTVSAVISGSAYFVNSYELLLFGRVLSGVGEAAFLCCTSPWIATNAPSVSKSKWLAVFFSAMPIGTALGYVYSSVIAATIGWQWSFFIEALYMCPMLCVLQYMSIRFPLLRSGERHFPDKGNSLSEEVRESLLGQEASGALTRLSDACSAGEIGMEVDETDDDLIKGDQDLVSTNSNSTIKPSMLEEVTIVISYPCYVYITLGYGALTAVLIGLATFGSAFFLGLDYFDSQVEASTAFGAIVSLAGVVGFPIGGLIVDRLVKRRDAASALEGKSSEHSDLIESSLVMTAAASVALVLYAMLYLIREKFAFFGLIFLATTAVFVCNAATSVGVIYSVPVPNRPFGIAFNGIVMHLIGDVPSPLVAGVLKDHFASGCIGDDDSVSTSDACRDDAPGIRLVMLLISLWLVWCSVFFGLSYLHALRMERVDNESLDRESRINQKNPLITLDEDENKDQPS